MKRIFCILPLLLLSSFIFSQEIEIAGNEKKLRLSSSVELRTWKLDTRAEKKEEPLMGASIVLLKGTSVVHRSSTNVTGGFEVLVPIGGEYVLEVSYQGCNTKRFFISTMNVPEDVRTADYFKPTFSIGGFVMAKPFPGIDYSGLQQTLVKVVYSPKLKNFDDDEAYTEAGLGIVSKIATAENTLIEKFCATNRAGDAALAKPDCPLAKKLYNEAIALIPGEQYPVEQLKKVGECLKAQEEADKKKAEEEAAKAEKARLAAEKAAAEKAAKEEAAKAAAEKAAAEKLAKEQAAKDNAAADKAAKDEAAKAAAEKAAADKLAKDQAAKEKAETDKAAKDKKAAEKAEADRVAREKAAADKAARDKAAAQKAEEAKTKTAAAKPKEPAPLSYETKSGSSEGAMDKGDSKHKVPQVLGANKYKEALNKAEGYFKMKRYAEAKTAYQEVLTIKPDDAYSKNKLAEIEKLMSK